MERDSIAFADNNIIGQLHGLDSNITEYLNKLYRPYGLSGLQHAFFTVIYRNPGVSQKELSHWFSLDLSNIARNVMHLEQIGYVHRERCATDRRGWLLYPTEEGKQIYPQVVNIFDTTVEHLTVGMTAEEKRLMSRLLQRMGQNLLEVSKSKYL